MKESKEIDLMAMNMTWFPGDLKVYNSQVGTVEATLLTSVKIIMLTMAVIAQTRRCFRSFLKLVLGSENFLHTVNSSD